MPRPLLLLLLFLSLGVTLAGGLLQSGTVERQEQARSALAVLFGDGRRLFANHFLAKADAYFHRGRYPSVFEVAARKRDEGVSQALLPGSAPEAVLPEKEAEAPGHVHTAECEHDHEDEHHHTEACDHAEPAAGPSDWISRLEHSLKPDQHVHLEAGAEREMLPWVKLAVEMDPHNVEAYAVGGYWLRELGHVDHAEAFLREGQRNNPDSAEIYFELARLYERDRGNLEHARRLYSLALQKWEKANAGVEDPDTLAMGQILGRLGYVCEQLGRLDEALRCYTALKAVSPNPQGVEALIEKLQRKMQARP